MISVISTCSSCCSPMTECYSYCSDLYFYVSEFPFFSEADYNVLTLQFVTNKSTNHGTPFYILVKSSEFAQFLKEDYQTIANLVAQPVEDPSHLASMCVIPGTTKTIKIKTPKEKSSAIYCLFTNPGEVWKYMIDHEEGSQKIRMELGEHEIKSIDKL